MKYVNRFFLMVAAVGACVACTAADITVDFSSTFGKVKPVHAVGQGPMLGNT